jgi:tetratricopeptide (TPR) repeat protein
LIQTGQLSIAEKTLRSALEQSSSRNDPDLPLVRDALVRLLRSEGRFGEARKLFIAGFDEWPDPVAALKGLYRLDTDIIPTEGMRTYVENSLRQAPDDVRVWQAKAHFCTQIGEFAEAEKWLIAAEKRLTSDKPYWRTRLEWALAADRPDQVADCLTHLPADPLEVERITAWFAARQGDPSTEIKALKQSIDLRPGQLVVLSRLAELATLQGRSDDASQYRANHARVNAASQRYRDLISKPDAKTHAIELSQLAAGLGMAIESSQWAIIAGQPKQVVPLAGSTAISLGELVPNATKPSETALASQAGGVPRFVENAKELGLTFSQRNGTSTDTSQLIPPTSSSGAVGVIDYDGDGWLDVYCVQSGEFPAGVTEGSETDRLYRNRGNGKFEDVSDRTGISKLVRGYGHDVTVGDIDNDGHADLFLTRWRSYVLLRNRGDGTFENVTERYGLAGDRDWPTSAAFADLDGDGDLDLYVCHYLKWDDKSTRLCTDPKDPSKYQCSPLSFESQPDHLFRNDGGKFVDLTKEAGIVDRNGRGLGVVASDLDGDGKIDLYVANDMSANYLFHNLGGMKFEEVAVSHGAGANASGGFQAGMGVASGDMDGDGLSDLLVTNFYAESTSLYRNLGQGFFSDQSASAGLALSSRYLLGFGIVNPDFNNDGRLDLLSANGHIHDGRPQFPYLMPMQLCLGSDRGRLIDVTSQAGPAFLEKFIGRGLASGDLNNDGKIDALMMAQNAPLVSLTNTTNPTGHFASFALEGRGSNRDGVGAVLTAHIGQKKWVRERTGGGSYQSASDPRVHFGLGNNAKIDRLEVRWPSGKIDQYLDLKSDTAYLLREGESSASRLKGWTDKPGTSQTIEGIPK